MSDEGPMVRLGWLNYSFAVDYRRVQSRDFVTHSALVSLACSSVCVHRRTCASAPRSMTSESMETWSNTLDWPRWSHRREMVGNSEGETALNGVRRIHPYHTCPLWPR